jgi:hypothetical protein
LEKLFRCLFIEKNVSLKMGFLAVEDGVVALVLPKKKKDGIIEWVDGYMSRKAKNVFTEALNVSSTVVFQVNFQHTAMEIRTLNYN